MSSPRRVCDLTAADILLDVAARQAGAVWVWERLGRREQPDWLANLYRVAMGQAALLGLVELAHEERGPLHVSLATRTEVRRTLPEMTLAIRGADMRYRAFGSGGRREIMAKTRCGGC